MIRSRYTKPESEDTYTLFILSRGESFAFAGMCIEFPCHGVLHEVEGCSCLERLDNRDELVGYKQALLSNGFIRQTPIAPSADAPPLDARESKIIYIQRDACGEFRVPGTSGSEASSYYTNDKSDAVGTAKLEWAEFAVTVRFRSVKDFSSC